MNDHTPDGGNFVSLTPDALTGHLARAARKELIAERMALTVQAELGRPLTPAELADALASATALLARLGDLARLPAAEQLEIACESEADS